MLLLDPIGDKLTLLCTLFNFYLDYQNICDRLEVIAMFSI
jgi:hypothetical protein